MSIDPFKKEKLLDSIEYLRSFIEDLEVNKTCASCDYYIESNSNCGLFKQTIPDHILKLGCEKWEFMGDYIPF